MIDAAIKHDSIAVTGMAGRFPGADSVAALVELLGAGRHLVRPLSTHRLRQLGLEPSPERYHPAGFIEDIATFDHDMFGLSPAEARAMDPQHRLLLEVVYAALESTGCPVGSYAGTATAVIAGDFSSHYHELARDLDPLLVTGNSSAAAVGRIARSFDLRGLATTVDTACSSSLVALHLALGELRSGRAERVVVCGANLGCYAQAIANEGLGVMSPTGAARSFDDAADGSTYGEAVVCVVVEPLRKAAAEGRRVFALVPGSAANQDAARSASLTAPNAEAQAEVMRAAWTDAGLAAAEIDYIEAHGTGTRLGDPIELRALALALEGERAQPCWLSALKSNIGHTDSAAGLAGVVKVVASLERAQIFPVAHFRRLNQLVDVAPGRLEVCQESVPWPRDPGSKRRAGVSSMGISGTNCHVVLEEAPSELASDRPSAPEDGEALIVLSARDAAALARVATGLVRHIENHPQCSLADLEHTLWRRELQAQRWVSRVSSRAELRRNLASLVQSAPEVGTRAGRAQLWLLFPDAEASNAAEVEAACARHPAFDRAYRQCLASAGDEAHSPRVRAFAQQWAWQATLSAWGLQTTRVLGLGVGKCVIDALADRLSLPEALEAARAEVRAAPAPAPAQADLRARLARFVDTKLRDSNSFVIELGPQTEAGMILDELAGQGSGSCVEALGHGGSRLLDVVAAALMAGVERDWRASRDGGDAGCIDLPSYPFTAHPHWLDVPGPAEDSSKAEGARDECTDGLIHAVRWLVVPAVSNSTARATSFVVVGDRDGPARQIAGELRARGASASLVSRDVALELALRGSVGQHFIYADTYRAEALEESQLFELRAFMADMDAAPDGLALTVPVVGAAAVCEGAGAEPMASATVAFVRAVAASHPRWRLRCIDLESVEDGDALALELMGEGIGFCPAYRGGQRHLPHVLPQAENDELCVVDDGVYVITGGARGVGAAVASALARRARVWLYLIGRSSSGDAQATLESLRRLGARASYRQIDVAQADAVRGLAAELAQLHGRLDGIVHCAGELGEHGPLVERSPQSLSATLAGKAYGARHVIDLAGKLDTGFVALFSSFNVLLPQRDSEDYAAANGYLDGLAHAARAEGLVVFSLAWSGWRDTGAITRLAGRESDGETDGPLRLLGSDDACRALLRALAGMQPHVAMLDIDDAAKTAQPFFAWRRRDSPSETSVTPLSLRAELAGIWARVLGLDTVEPDADFFELGGHSLNASAVLTEIRSRLGVELAFDAFYDHPRLDELADLLEAKCGANLADPHEGIAAVADAPHHPLSHAQHRLWLFEQSHPNSVVYNNPGSGRLRGELDIAAFSMAWRELVRRHEILRTRIVVVEGVPRQVVDAACEFTILQEDFTAASDPEAEVSACAHKLATTAFDLAEGPLLRVLLCRLAEQEYVLLYSTHHIVSDGWSVSLMMNEVIANYRALRADASAPHAPLAIQYRDYASWHNARMASDAVDGLRRYWHERLADFPRSSLPTCEARAAKRRHEGAVRGLVLDSERSQALRSAARAEGVSTFMYMLCAIATTLAQLSGRDDIVVGTPMAGRQHPDLSDQIGFYVNTVVLRLSLSGADDFRSALARVKDRCLEAYDHQDYPFDRLVDDLDPTPPAGRSPIFDVMVQMQNNAPISADIPGLEVSPYAHPQLVSKFDLTFDIIDDESLAIDLEYDRHLWHSAQIDSWLARLDAVLREAVAAPQLSLDDMATRLMSDAERNEQRAFERSLGSLDEDF